MIARVKSLFIMIVIIIMTSFGKQVNSHPCADTISCSTIHHSKLYFVFDLNNNNVQLFYLGSKGLLPVFQWKTSVLLLLSSFMKCLTKIYYYDVLTTMLIKLRTLLKLLNLGLLIVSKFNFVTITSIMCCLQYFKHELTIKSAAMALIPKISVRIILIKIMLKQFA